MEKLDEIEKTWRFKLERNVDSNDVESLYLLACIAGEAGELANLGKKIFQRNYLNHDRLKLTDDEIKKEEMQEIGDILYYLYKYASHRGINIDEAWKLTMAKNMKRYTKS